VNDVPCGNKFTMMNSFGLKKIVSIDLFRLIVWRILRGNSSSIIIHDPVGGLVHMVQDSSPAQELTHLRFWSVIRAARSRSVCCTLSAFDHLTAGGTLIAKSRNLRPSTSVKR
jgi:hypothetical protein